MKNDSKTEATKKVCTEFGLKTETVDPIRQLNDFQGAQKVEDPALVTVDKREEAIQAMVDKLTKKASDEPTDDELKANGFCCRQMWDCEAIQGTEGAEPGYEIINKLDASFSGMIIEDYIEWKEINFCPFCGHRYKK